MLDGTYYVDCTCAHPEHTLRFMLDKDPEFPCVYMETYLSKAPWYYRLKIGFKYILGFRDTSGCFNETILEEKELQQIEKIIAKFRK